MTDRVKPTPEDMVIFERNLRRMTRWLRESNQPRTKAGALSILGSLKRFTNDFIEPEIAK